MSLGKFDYDKAIAQAARDWRRTTDDADWKRTDALYLAASIAYERLCWMIDAEKYGWNPDDFRSETKG